MGSSLIQLGCKFFEHRDYSYTVHHYRGVLGTYQKLTQDYMIPTIWKTSWKRWAPSGYLKKSKKKALENIEENPNFMT